MSNAVSVVLPLVHNPSYFSATLPRMKNLRHPLSFSIPYTHYVMLFMGGGWGETDEEEERGRHSSHCTWTIVTGFARTHATSVSQWQRLPSRYNNRGVRIRMIYSSCRYEHVWEDGLMLIEI